jgi:NADH:ubiquinone oxidoreductase subunit 3 (subunit A)
MTMSDLLLSPPVAFLIFLAVSLLISRFTKFIAAKGMVLTGKNKAYACGEEVAQNRARPEYEQFFHIAYFFTIMHVIGLMIATDPSGFSPIVGIYLAAALVALLILFRR